MTATVFTLVATLCIVLSFVISFIYDGISSKKKTREENLERYNRTIRYTNGLLKAANALPQAHSILEVLYRRQLLTLEYISVINHAPTSVSSHLNNVRARVAHFSDEADEVDWSSRPLVLPESKEERETLKRTLFLIHQFLIAEDEAKVLPSHTISKALATLDLFNCMLSAESHYRTAKHSFDSGRLGTSKLHLEKALHNISRYSGDPLDLLAIKCKVETLSKETQSILTQKTTELLAIKKPMERLDGLDRMEDGIKVHWQ